MGDEQPFARIEAREPVKHRFTVEEFLAMDAAGLFEKVGRVELIDGEVYEMAPLYRPHARTLMELTVAFALAARELDGLEALTPISARLDPYSLPEADIVIAVDEEAELVTAESVRLLVEVSASSLRHDLGVKARLYARTGVPEYWVADVAGHRIIRFHAPQGEAYTERAEFPFGATVSSATIPALSIDTARLA
jgi:Uma2 family endonuclease